MTISQYVNMSISLLAVLNPLGGAAIYLSMIGGFSDADLKAIPPRFTIGVIVTLLISFWVGHYFLTLFGINLPSFQVAGGLILVLIGLGQILPKAESDSSTTPVSEKKANIAIVPLAIPLVAGPGGIAIVISDAEIMHSHLIDKFIFCLILIVLGLFMGVMIKYAPSIGKKLGSAAMSTVARVMGLIIAAIGMNMLAHGMLSLFPGLH